ncbi:hypothetical protein ASPZODRAFT_129378 [Penicilliopsis zonata CBS 506.65]|uniref:Enoyl reductase (ER) domain-containing protein n=1 Tax=Penicilliopsis zonata CBS 506.65 TaxID=1073090 RepID=A0A1L9SPM0_9EURO|nr:hypothetical protein ASPZODRAFT_129378 [Penicilliopsis zonata CBS 506.65]OJJ49007.1 hypothetical protein ASPZODRAFT_129378 [Penicilliopsis zonata CBS 506.65]
MSMTAVVIRTAGGPEVLKLERLPIPTVKSEHVLIRIKAFGLNRSDLFIRQGHSLGVTSVAFPRVLGIEAVGVIESAPGLEDRFPPGAKVATAMGGMGRAFDGGYAEYTSVPAKQVQVLDTTLPWEVLGALPEMLQTAWGSLMKALELEEGDRLLIRGGTTSVGLTAAAIAKNKGAFVASTTRKVEREALLKENGADEVWIEDGDIAGQLEKSAHEKFDKVLELVGTITLKDSLRCVKKGGIVCLTGVVGNEWTMERINPMQLIPSQTKLTIYGGSDANFMTTPLPDLIKQVEENRLKIKVGRVFHMEQIVEAHQCMEDNAAGGKVVVLV